MSDYKKHFYNDLTIEDILFWAHSNEITITKLYPPEEYFDETLYYSDEQTIKRWIYQGRLESLLIFLLEEVVLVTKMKHILKVF